MPIKIGKMVFRDFETAAKVVARQKGWSLKRARAYVAEIDRRQNKKKHKGRKKR